MEIIYTMQNVILYCFSLELAGEVCTSHMYCSLKGNKEGERGEEVRKYRIYSDAKYNNVECLFPENANCFVKCYLHAKNQALIINTV
jgi:hypothetical protein